jgi:small subunit ribosomal protein S18
MARGSDRGSSPRRGAKDAARRIKKKPCALCRDKTSWVDYKDVNMLRKYMSDRGKIRARRVTGNCSQHQRAIALAIRTARELALVPYTQRTVTERGGGRGRRGERGERGGRGREDRSPAAPAPEEAAAPDVEAGGAEAPAEEAAEAPAEVEEAV